MNNKLLALSIVGAIALFGLFSSVYTVSEREQAIIVRFGEYQRTVNTAGLHFKIPVYEQVLRLEKRVLSLDLPAVEVIAKDQRKILVDSFARYRIVDPLKRYQAASNDAIAANLLAKILDAAVRNVLGQIAMNDIVTGERAALMEEIGRVTTSEARSMGLEVIDVRLKRVDLPPENSQAIFQRMETERQQEAAEKRAEGERDKVKIMAGADRQAAVLVAEAEREAQIIRGQADGIAVKTFAEAFGKDEEFFEFYRTMQAYRKALGKEDTTLVLSPDSEFFKLFVNSKNK